MNDTGFYHWQDDVLHLKVYLQPRASRDDIVGPHDGALKIRLTAPPVDGKANARLLRFLAGIFDVPRRQVVLESGHGSRRKQLRILQPRRLPEGIKSPG